MCGQALETECLVEKLVIAPGMVGHCVISLLGRRRKTKRPVQPELHCESEDSRGYIKHCLKKAEIVYKGEEDEPLHCHSPRNSELTIYTAKRAGNPCLLEILREIGNRGRYCVRYVRV